MQQIEISVEPRSTAGSAEARRVRSEGKIPCVCYHRHESPMHGAVSLREFTNIASRVRPNQIFTLKSSNASLNGKAAVVKEIQESYVKRSLLHIDFQLIRDDEEITVSVGLKFVGEAPGVKLDGGILTVAMHEVEVSCLPKNIPDMIEVDISTLKMGENIHAGDLKIPAGVKLLVDSDRSIASVVQPKALEVAAPAAEAAAPAEGAAAEGAAPAEGAAAAPATEKKEK
ncbi:MAG: 50S ribosomal protein L25 [Bdellovibrionota bacterium]|nr:MAG: 50S ribosomal protein L25 [Bdellovibrionota bacterium]